MTEEQRRTLQQRARRVREMRDWLATAANLMMWFSTQMDAGEDGPGTAEDLLRACERYASARRWLVEAEADMEALVRELVPEMGDSLLSHIWNPERTR